MLRTPASAKSEALTPGVLHMILETIFEKSIIISWKEFETGLKNLEVGKRLKEH